MRQLFLSLVAVAVALSSLGCQPEQGTSTTPTTSGGITFINGAAKLKGQVLGPAGLVANNSAGLVANNSAGYQTQAFAQSALQYALLYLTSPDERFYLDDKGQAISAMTDAEGRYQFALAPVDHPVVVTAVLAQNRRMVGYIKPQAGDNALDINVATTLVTEFLRKKAREKGGLATMGSFDLSKLPQLVALTQAMLDAGGLAIDPEQDLNVNQIPTLVGRYVGAMASHSDPALKQAWESVLGEAIVAVSTVTGTGIPSSHQPFALASDIRSSVTPPGAIYVSSSTATETRIDWLKPDGSTASIAVGARSATFKDQYGGVELYKVRALAVDPDGKLYYADMDRTGTTEPRRFIYRIDPAVGGAPELLDLKGNELNKVSALTFDPQGNLFLTDSASNSIYQIPQASLAAHAAITPVRWAGAGGAVAFSGDDGPALAAKFSNPVDATYHDGALYVVDHGNNRIRRVAINSDGSAGNVTTVAGCGPDPLNGTVIAGSFAGDGGPATQAKLYFPKKVLFDADGRMIIGDGDNHRIRVVSNGIIKTLAGKEPGSQDEAASEGEAKDVVLGQIESMTWDRNGNLLLTDFKAVRRVVLRGGSND